MAHIDHPHNTVKPPLSPAVRHPLAQRTRFNEDSAKYILQPDEDFARPYLAIPRGRAYVWPLGVEGFDIQSNAQLGIHKYLGEIELDVSITHRSEKHIQMSGVFPGWTSDSNMRALQDVYEADTPENGKILYLPGIFTHFNYVVGESLNFRHAEEDRTQDIQYAISFIKVGLGKRITPRPRAQPPVGGKGKGKRIFTVNSRYNTLREIAQRVFKNRRRWTELYARNARWFDTRRIPSHQIPDYVIPNGTKIRY